MKSRDIWRCPGTQLARWAQKEDLPEGEVSQTGRAFWERRQGRDPREARGRSPAGSRGSRTVRHIRVRPFTVHPDPQLIPSSGATEKGKGLQALGFYSCVASRTEGDQVVQSVCIRTRRKKAKWNQVMHVQLPSQALLRNPTPPTRKQVPLPNLSSPVLPVPATMSRSAVKPQKVFVLALLPGPAAFLAAEDHPEAVPDVPDRGCKCPAALDADRSGLPLSLDPLRIRERQGHLSGDWRGLRASLPGCI